MNVARINTRNFGAPLGEYDKPNAWGRMAFGMAAAALLATTCWFHIFK